MAVKWYNKYMMNKTRFLIDSKRTYVVKIDNDTEIEVSGSDIVRLATAISKQYEYWNNVNKPIRHLEDLDETGKVWF